MNLVSKRVQVIELANAFASPIMWVLFPIGLLSSDSVLVLLTHLFYLHIGPKISLIIHECGHAFTAKIIGGKPWLMSLGHGHQISSFRAFGIRILIHEVLSGGMMMSSIDFLGSSKFQRIIYTLGGILFNFLAAALLLLPYIKSFDLEEIIMSKSPFLALALVNLYMGFRNLIPKSSFMKGMAMNNDGQTVLDIIRNQELDSSLFKHNQTILEANEHFYSNRIDLAIGKIELELKKHPGDVVLMYALLAFGIHQGKAASLKGLTRSLINVKEDNKFKAYHALFNHALANYFLMVNDIEQADYYSKLAYESNQSSYEINGTRGAILVELGKYKEGLDILRPHINLRYLDSMTFEAALYVAIGHANGGDITKALKLLRFLNKFEDRIAPDVKLLYDRHIERLTERINNLREDEKPK